MNCTALSGKNRKTAQSYADSSTKNAIEHLKTIHRIDADGEMEPLADQNNRIRAAFGRTLPKVFFNVEFFKVLLVRWVISCNIPFRASSILPFVCWLVTWLLVYVSTPFQVHD
jgi:hypothetical protein